MAECQHVNYSRFNLRAGSILYWCHRCGSVVERQSGEDEPRSWNTPEYWIDVNPISQGLCIIKGCPDPSKPDYNFCRTHLNQFFNSVDIENKKKGMLGEPVPMLLWCPECGKRHIDVGEFSKQLHHTHACQHCGMVWKPAQVFTVGVEFLPGYRNGEMVKLQSHD